MTKIIHKLRTNQGRDKQLLMNMGVSLLVKGMGILNTFLLVPLYLAYLDKSTYGIWLALASLLTWMRFFEFGLGNGLKNRLTNALSDEDFKLGKEYVSTAYFYLFILITFAIIIWLSINSFIPWNQLFKADIGEYSQASGLIIIVVSAFLTNIFFQLIQSVLHSVQATRKADSIGLFNNLSILIGIFILSRVDPAGGDILKVGLIAAWVPVIGLFLATIYFYFFSKNAILRKIRPSLKAIRKSHFKALFGLGIKFFVIQVSMLVIFQSANFLILAHFSSDQVVDYHILNKYFSVGHMVMSLLFAPLWPAITDAYHRGEIRWIRKRVQMFFGVFLLFASLIVIQFFIGNTVISFWLSETYLMNNTLAIALMVYYSFFILGGIYNTVMNALSRLNWQTYLLGLGALLFYPFFLLFKNYFGLGVESVVLAMFFANTYTIVIAPIQYFKIVVRARKN